MSILRSEQNLTENRIVWVDIVKGYAMLFVLLHHLIITFSVKCYSTFYAPFFLTAFFVVAGYTFKSNRSFPRFFVRKVQTLLIPLFSLGLICISLSQILSFSEQESFNEQVLGLLIQNSTAGHRLWFIAAMFISCCVFYPISRLNEKKIIITSIILAGLNIILKKYITIYLPWHLSVLGIACFWMGVGYYLKNYIPRTEFEFFLKSKKTLTVLAIIYCICYK